MAAKQNRVDALSLAVQPDLPLIGVVLIENGEEVVRYFANEADATDRRALRRYLLDTTPLAAYLLGRPQPAILSDHAHQGLHQGCDISCPRAFGTATGDPVEVIAIDAFKTQGVERTAEFGVLLNGIRQEMLDLETDDRICLGVDSCIDVVAIPAIERDARGRTRPSVEVDEKRVRRSIVRKLHLI